MSPLAQVPRKREFRPHPAWPLRIDTTAGPDACWPWMGNRQTNPRGPGYGIVRVGGRPVYTHRRALEEALGRSHGPGIEACHTCDNPPCCNPAHLFEGTHADNMRDARAKGRVGAGVHPERVLRGERHPGSTLSDAQVIEIRTRFATTGITQTALAQEYGVSLSVINKRLAQVGLRGRRLAA